MPPNPRASYHRRPRQGALVVLLSAMAMINLAVLVLVFTGDRLWGTTDRAPNNTEVALTHAPADAAEPTARPGVSPDAAVSADPVPYRNRPETGTTHGRAPVEPAETAHADPATRPQPPATPPALADPPADEPVSQAVPDLPPLEFFGIPVFD